MNARFRCAAWSVLIALTWGPVLAQNNASPAAQVVQVTATRFGEPIQEVPGSISVVTGDSLRARGATDLRTALAMLGGVSVAMGGDAGPASAVPGLLGVREVDDLLLLVDGIPAGGAFTPQVEAISLVNVERIEVLRGAAPVYFGTTAFAGTINVIHYAAGRADSSVSLRGGSRRSVGVSGAAVLSTGEFRQSISAEFSDDKVADPRAGYKRAQGSWRLATDIAGGSARADLNLLALRQKPNSPTPIDIDTGQLITLLPKDFNQNPANAKLNTDRAQLVLGYELPLSFGRFSSSLAYTQTQSDNVRAFIDFEDSPQPWTQETVAAIEANHQNRRLRELFVDSHFTSQPVPGWDLTTGVNLLLGRAKVKSLRFALELPLDGKSAAPNIESVAPKTDVDLADSRRFLGLYAQSRFKLSDNASVLAGLRWNSTKESRSETRISLASGDVVASDDSQNINRFSGSVGGRWQVYRAAQGAFNALTLHASVGNTFQPAQLDFNPNPEPKADGGGLLKPETQRSVVAGFKVDALDGMLDFDVDGFLVDFNNQPVLVTVGDNTALRSVGQQRYKGIDIEGTLRPTADWTLKASATWSDARYRDFVTDIDGQPAQLAGKRQVLTPTWRASAGIVYAPERGLRASLTTSFTGKHWLDRLNENQASGYTLVDASLGYRFESFTVQISGRNLGNRRDAAQMSELGEGQFYRLPARHVDVMLTVPLP
jgi:iron complex outermembrane recepter protein